jgi:DnaJ-class molecular chaperone
VAEATLSIPFLTAVLGGETSIEVDRDGHRESLVVKIPAGVDTGSKLRLRGQGEPIGHGGARGDLVITLAVLPHAYFTREGRNLIVEAPVAVAEAILGARIDVPTLEGLRTLTIPPGTSSGQKLRLRGQGVPASKDLPAGDLFVVAKVIVPKSVDDESRRLIEQFAERNPQTPRAGLW